MSPQTVVSVLVTGKVIVDACVKDCVGKGEGNCDSKCRGWAATCHEAGDITVSYKGFLGPMSKSPH